MLFLIGSIIQTLNSYVLGYSRKFRRKLCVWPFWSFFYILSTKRLFWKWQFGQRWIMRSYDFNSSFPNYKNVSPPIKVSYLKFNLITDVKFICFSSFSLSLAPALLLALSCYLHIYLYLYGSRNIMSIFR